MLTIILIAVFGFLFLKFNEFEDESVRNNWKGRWAWLNQRGSWKRKWLIVNNQTIAFVPTYIFIKIPFTKKRLKLPVEWYYFGVYPDNVERFLFSSTLLVWLTDPEHYFQFVKLRMIELAFLCVSWKLALSWWIGTRIFALVKERWLPFIR